MSSLPAWIADWWQGWTCLGVGFAFGALYLLLSRKDSTPAADVEAEIADADRRKDLLVEELRELAEERHKLDPARYQSERERLEAAAADALRARDVALQKLKRPPKREAAATAKGPAPTPKGGASTPKPAGDVPGWFAQHPQFKGAAWGGGLVLFFVIIWRLVTAAEAPRTEGGSMTGINPSAGGMGGAASASGSTSKQEGPDDALAPLVQAVQRDPMDIAALNRLTHELVFRDDFTNASEFTERVLRIDPIDVEARAHRAVLKSARGDDQAALDELGKLARRYPNAPEVFLFDGLTAQRAKQNKRAIESLEHYVQLAPTGADTSEVRSTIASIRSGATPRE